MKSDLEKANAIVLKHVAWSEDGVFSPEWRVCRDDLLKEVAAALKAERESLPESVRECLVKLKGIPSINEALEDLEKWQASGDAAGSV